MNMAILLIPGFMTDRRLWDDCLEAFRPLGPVQHVDTSRDGSIEDIAARALHAAPRQFILVGFSFGGYIAREMARCAPERIQALVLVATSARGDNPHRKQASHPATEGQSASFSGLSRRAIKTSLHPDHADDATVERIRSMGVRLGAEVLRKQSEMDRTGDLSRLAQITCPTLVIAAAGDRVRSIAESVELRDGLPNATLSIIENSGHMIPIEAPQAFTASVLDWLKSLPHLGPTP